MQTFNFWLLCLTLSVSWANSREREEETLKTKEIQMQHEHPTPTYLYKIASPEEWKASQHQKQVVLSAMDQEFIHLATEEQLAHIAQKFWPNKEHIILKLASCQLTGHLVYETNPGGTTLYYHLYEGKIPLEAVVSATHVRAIKN